MTREEVVKLLEKATTVEAAIDAYVALGMLKLDEPKSARDKMRDFLRDRLHYDTNAPIWDDLDMALEGAGLKIVEK